VKKSFGLIGVIFLILIFSFLSVNIVQNQTFSNKIDQLKYLHLQANIHINHLKKYIKTHTKAQISTYSLDDDRFILFIQAEDINNSTVKYHLNIKTKDDTHISIYDSIIKL
jgi:hypothetical protein